MFVGSLFTDSYPRLLGRLRRAPSASTVPNSLPVLFFGSISTATIATVGLNPSDRECLDKDGSELTGSKRRFETLTSLGAETRAALTDEHCRRAIERMEGYFRPGMPIYSWFRALDRVTGAMGATYEQGEVVHLDLVQEATDPTWSNLARTSPNEFTTLRAADLPFLRWQLETFPLQTVLCNGRTVFDGVIGLLQAETIETDRIERITWTLARADVNGRMVHVVGWNLPLARPTGLGTEGERRFGQLLAERLHARAAGTKLKSAGQRLE